MLTVELYQDNFLKACVIIPFDNSTPLATTNTLMTHSVNESQECACVVKFHCTFVVLLPLGG